MRISDLSSDVCSSDLAARAARPGPGARAGHPLSDGDAVAPDLWHSDGAYAVFRGGAGHRAAGFCRHGRARQVPDAGGGHRMIQAPDLPAWAAIIIGLLVLAGSAIALVDRKGTRLN